MGSVTFSKIVHSANTFVPILITEVGMIIVVNPDPLNAPSPILITEVGIIIDVKLLHSLNTSFPMLVIEFGIVIERSFCGKGT